MPKDLPVFLLLCLSTVMVLLLGVLISRMKNKQQLHSVFLILVAAMFYWDAIRLFQCVLLMFYGRSYTVLENIHYIGVAILPLAVFFTGVVFAKTKVRFNTKYKLLCIIPAISIIMALTNPLHHLFIREYSFISTEFVYGPYYWVHEIYSYFLIAIGLFYLLFYSIKNSGFFSKQSLLISLGLLLPLIVIVASTQGIITMPVFVENISFSFAILCFSIAIFKLGFLSVLPVALQKIVDLISDSYIVVNGDMEIIDYNKTFLTTFSPIFPVSRKDNFLKLLMNRPEVHFNIKEITKNVSVAIDRQESVRLENHVTAADFDRYFEMDIIPICSEKSLLGIILLFKDVSQHKRDIAIIKQNQEILLEQERLASLGQMIGGIAHNMRTPIMSVAGGIEALTDLTDEYLSSIGDPEVTVEDHREIGREMQKWLIKMKPYCAYMSDVISAVKGQAVQLNDSSTDKFTVEELVKRVDLLMKHELKRFHCWLGTDFQVDMNAEIKGELNNLVQVFDNLIMNAIQAYEGKEGQIRFQIKQKGDQLEFALSDKGRGIPQQIRKRLFKEMVTTKGKNGTGLGLYMSYSTIRGRFGGNMSFSSKEGEGTTFYISIPRLLGAQEKEAAK